MLRMLTGLFDLTAMTVTMAALTGSMPGVSPSGKWSPTLLQETSVYEPRMGVWLGNSERESGGGQSGVVIRKMLPGGPAERAGLREADVVIVCDEEPLVNATQTIRLLRAKRPADAVELALLRRGERQEVIVLLDSEALRRFISAFDSVRRQEGPYLRMLPRGTVERVGLSVRALTPHLADYFRLRKRGVLIESVRSWSPAYRAGLRAGDVIIALDGTHINELADLARRLQRDLSGETLLIDIWRDRRVSKIEVQIK